MHRSLECSTTPSSVEKKQFTGQTAAHGASVQCMHAIDTERSPGLPSLMVTTRRRLMPHGTSCSFLQAVTHALHSMQRSASQRNFIRAMICRLPSSRSYLAERGLGLLHSGEWVVAVGRDRIHALAQHDRIGALRVLAALIDALEPAREVERHPGHALADTLGHQRLHAAGLAARHFGTRYQDPGAVLDAARRRILRVDLDERILLQLGEPLVG